MSERQLQQQKRLQKLTGLFITVLLVLFIFFPDPAAGQAVTIDLGDRSGSATARVEQAAPVSRRSCELHGRQLWKGWNSGQTARPGQARYHDHIVFERRRLCEQPLHSMARIEVSVVARRGAPPHLDRPLTVAPAALAPLIDPEFGPTILNPRV